MTFVVGEDCIKCKHTDCVEVLPGPTVSMKAPICWSFTRTSALTVPCASLSARWTRSSPKMNCLKTRRCFLELNAELAEVWPVITEMKDSPPDAEEWEGKTRQAAVPGEITLFYIVIARSRRRCGNLAEYPRR